MAFARSFVARRATEGSDADNSDVGTVYHLSPRITR